MDLSTLLTVAAWATLSLLWWGATWADARLALAKADEEVGR